MMSNKNKALCTHCGLDIPADLSISSDYLLEGQSPTFCCYGCKAVYEMLNQQHLEDFYIQRSHLNLQDNKLLVDSSLKHLDSIQSDISPDGIEEKVYAQFLRYDDPENQARFLINENLDNSNNNTYKQSIIEIEGMTCSACVQLNEHYLSQKEGVKSVSVNIANHQMYIQFDIEKISLSQILSAIKALGYIPHSLSNDNHALQVKALREMIWKLFIAGFGAMQAMSFSVPLYFSSENISSAEMQILRWTTLIITTPVLLFSGRDYIINSIKDILRRRLSMDVPIALGLSLGYLHSAYITFSATGENIYLDSMAMLLFFLLGGKFFELRAQQKINENFYGKLRNQAITAWRLIDNEQTEEVAISELKAGDSILIKHGNIIPADGVLLSSTHQVEIDESMLTGESHPVEKKLSEQLNAGTVNSGEAFTMTVSVGGGERGRIRQEIEILVAKALSAKPKFILIALVIARWFIFTLLLLSTITFSLWFYFVDINSAIKITIALLVVTCPCALALAAPVTLSSLMAVLLKQGSILKNPAVLEHSSKLSRIIIDKTGTLTKGRLSVINTYIFNESDSWHEDIALNLACQIEEKSEHPIALAFNKDHLKIRTHELNLINVNRHSSLGLSSRLITDDKNDDLSGEWLIGKATFCKISAEEEQNIVNKISAENSKKTRVYLAENITTHSSSKPKPRKISVFILEDELHVEAKETINNWQKAGLLVNILSGDRREVVEEMAQKLDIPSNLVFSECSPKQKTEFVQACKNSGEVVMMIGDGVNDAPVLSLADISIGMPNASDLSKISADIILLKGSSGALPWLRIAEILPMLKRAKNTLWQNYTWGISYNLIMVPIAMLGYVNPWVAGLGMTISSLVVLFNSLRLFRQYSCCSAT